MRHVVFAVIGILIAVAIGFFVLRYNAIAPEETPTPTGSASVSSTPLGNINVDSPKVNATVGNPITVTGMARTFESVVNWRLMDMRGNKLIEGNTMASAPDVGQYGYYTFSIPVPAGVPDHLQIWVFQYSAKDGSVADLVTVPVVVQQ